MVLLRQLLLPSQVYFKIIVVASQPVTALSGAYSKLKVTGPFMMIQVLSVTKSNCHCTLSLYSGLYIPALQIADLVKCLVQLEVARQCQ